MNDDEFFAEQDRRMNIPEEDVDAYIQTCLAATRKNQSTEVRAPDSPIDSHRRYKRSLELDTAGKSKSPESGNKPDPSSTIEKCTPTAECCAKRRKTTDSITELMDRLPHVDDVPILDAPTPRITARSVFGAAANPIGSRESQQVRSVGNDQNSMSASTDLALECDRDPRTPFVQAVPLTEEISGYSTCPDAPASEMRMVQTPQRQELNTALVSTPDDPSIMDVFSLPQISLRHNTTAFSSSTFDGHGNNYGFPANSQRLSLTDGILEIASSVILAASSFRVSGDSHKAGYTSQCPMPRTSAGLDPAMNLDVSDVASPDTLSGQFRRARGDSSAAGKPSSSNALAPKDPKARKTVNSDRRSRKASGSGKSSKQVKDKPKLITPLEYAQKLQSCLDLPVKSNYLKGKRIFYVGGDMMYASTTTRGRMDYIVKHGGTVVPKYDPAIVTHIVTDARVRPTLRALSLKSLSDIPDHIPTVAWEWVVSGYKRAGKRKLLDSGEKGKGKEEGDQGDDDNLFDFEFMHAAFPERIDAGCSWKNMRRSKQGEKVAQHDTASGADSPHDDSGDVSHISNFSQENKQTRTAERGVPLTVLPPLPLDFQSVDGGKTEGRAVQGREKSLENNDPLSEYYAQARAEREAQWNQDASDSDDGDDDVHYPKVSAPRRGFACDLKGLKQTICVNQRIVDKLEELRELHKAKSSDDDRWRAYSYGKCIPAIRNYPKPIKSFSEARSIRGVGEKTALKIMEIISTGDLKRIKYENTEDVAATRVFQGIYGVGRHIAFIWFANGLRTLDDVKVGKNGVKLSTAQEIGLKFYDDINSRMPREEARRIFDMIKPIALDIDSKLFIEIMGSYRRGKADCGDIDILITRPTTDGKTHQGVLRTLLERLHAAGILTEDLAVPEDFSDLELVYRGLCKLPEPGAKRRRIDFLCVPWESRGAALLYYTGDDIFNRAMRLKANKHGYSLNQRGLYAGVVRDPHDRQKKVCEGHIVASETEEEIFKILGVPWQEPHERVRGS